MGRSSPRHAVVLAPLGKLALPQSVGEFGCWQDVDPVVGAAGARFKANHESLDTGMLFGQGAEALEVLAGNRGG